MTKKRKEELEAIYGSDKTPLIIGKIEIPCYVLNDGTRVFSGRGLQKAIGASPNTSGKWLQKFINEDRISSYLNPEVLEKFNSPLKFKRPLASGSQTATYGYEATLLVDICDAILQAKKSREKIPKNIIASAEAIIRSVARVGIIALVDEATGYVNAKDRAKDALQQFLDKFLRDEAAKWVKTFQDNFFEMLFNLNGWTWNDLTKLKKPSVIGHYINDYVYSRLAPGVLDELRQRNPRDKETGNRKTKHHQWLGDNYAHPKLREHFASIQSLYRISGNNKAKFEKLLDQALPKYGHTLEIVFPEDNTTQYPDNSLSTFNRNLKKTLTYIPKEE